MENTKKIKPVTDHRKIEEAVKKFKKKKACEPKNFWFYIKALHTIPDMKKWLTIESMPLMPLVEKRDGNWIFNFLFVTNSEDKNINKPWGFASVSLPEGKVLQTVKFNKKIIEAMPIIEKKMLCNRKFIDLIQIAFDTDSKISLPPKDLLEIYKTLSADKKESDKEIPINNGKPDWSALFEFMDKFSKILINDNQSDILKQLRVAKKRLEQPLFSVAVVGEFSRGKSTLLNSLLGEELLPVGDLPTTAMLTKIVYGDKKRIFHFNSTGKEEINEEQWEKLVADENGNDPEGVLLVETKNDFLGKNGIQMIDTPGAGDVFGKRAAITTESISSCDATIVAVSATMPLSLTEKSFVEDNIFLKKVPRVAVVITRLDQVNEGDRLKVCDYIKNEVAKWGKDVQVWISGQNIGKLDGDMVFGTDNILFKISEWSSSSDNEDLRYDQIICQMNSLVNLCFKILNEKKQLLQLNKDEIAKKINMEKEQILRKDLIWEDILIEIDKREVDFTEWLSKALHEKEPEVKEEFFIGLKNFPDPKKWWEEVFPALLKRRIQSLTKDFNSAISRKVAADSEQVADFTKQKFDCDIAINKQNIAMEKMEIDTNFENKPEIKGNLDRMKNISRLSSAGAFMGSMLLLPGAPIGMIISAMAGIYGEKVIKGKIEEQRSQVEKYVEDVVSEALDKMIKESKKQISKTYISIATNIKKEKSIWQNNIIKTFENINELDVTKQLAEIETKTEMFIELTKNMNGDRCD